MVAIHGPQVRPRLVLVVRGSLLQPLPKPSSENRLSLDPWSVAQTVVRPRSVGLTVGEGQQPVRGKLLIGSTSNGHNS
ncbi:hypothetical protein MTR67_002496 [Solanum verrucosum]|uniref:Uncharacterized protein n=1 Tax=Solanum verrucosum TaxID=315347 RepID=A0AAF0T8G8_SOLVR|nr:hypothetical protein MTR67_002496 [Solanum verrucosum]